MAILFTSLVYSLKQLEYVRFFANIPGFRTIGMCFNFRTNLAGWRLNEWIIPFRR